MGFWGALALVNICFFLPYYLLNIRSQPNPLAFLTDRQVSFGNKIKAIYYKVSSDPFKVFYEYTGLILIGHLLGMLNVTYVVLCTIIGCIGWVIILYSGVMRYVFQRSPILRSDWEFMKIGWKMNYNNRFIIVITAVALVILMFSLLYFVSFYLLTFHPSTNVVGGVLGVLTILALVKIQRIYYDRFIYRTVLSSFYFLHRNYKYSNRFNDLFDLTPAYFESLNQYKDLNLSEKPNVYLFSVESYGGVLYEDGESLESIQELYKKYEAQLEAQGFYMSSHLSEAPVSGGGSWKCYSSWTYGIKIDDDLLYNMLFKSLPAFKNYDSIFHTFRRQGYKNILLCPATNHIEGTVDWDLIQSNLQSDTYLTWDRMVYTGEQVPFMGNCYAPPDQYSLDRAQHLLAGETDPYVLFFSTLNSHYPFMTPTRLVDDVQSLNDGASVEVISKKSHPLRRRYALAMRYQLEVIFDFIARQDDGIFVLVGDHQPPRIAGAEADNRTPVHVITKYAGLHDSLHRDHFVSGLMPKVDSNQHLRHEGLYSLIMRGIYTAFGPNQEKAKPYLADGVKLKA